MHHYIYNHKYDQADQCLVLDLDRAMLFSHDLGCREEMKSAYCRAYKHGAINQFHVIADWNRITHFRQHIREFLDYAQFRFTKKVIWSAGGKLNVFAMTQALENMSAIKFDLVLTGEETKFTEEQPFGVKDLVKVYACLPKCGPTNTFIVDDHVSNFIQNPNNGIVIPEFVPSDPSTLESNLDLLVLIEWFDQIAVLESADVRDLKLSEVFTIFKESSKEFNKGRLR